MNCFSPKKPTMSSLQMVPLSKLRYQKLRHEKGSDDERDRVSEKPRFRFKRVPIRRRFRLKISSFRKLWRKRGRLVSSVRVSYAKVLKRFKDGQVHFGDLFAGNYLFMHVNPTSLKSLQRDLHLSKIP
ncbi:hypothetical protein VIGAN_04255000 [Vigna angularis var. angularis]|uniref:Uncharacterized protein n=2 Tax=Phaseolus angularis TaxID=3914 RepID=A0A0S3RWZ3_PHAAN|nr:hypothetical protein VIGAN_04255000 [Vigna angularis var. angularis]